MDQDGLEDSRKEPGDEGKGSRWFKFQREYSPEEKRLLLSRVVLIALETVFANHIYQCENSLYKQRTGGGIGARITGVG